jgi:hypothetical protein
MQGGGVWKAAEFTDDTQMAILVAESLLDRDGLDVPDLFSRFQASFAPFGLGASAAALSRPPSRAADLTGLSCLSRIHLGSRVRSRATNDPSLAVESGARQKPRLFSQEDAMFPFRAPAAGAARCLGQRLPILGWARLLAGTASIVVVASASAAGEAKNSPNGEDSAWRIDAEEAIERVFDAKRLWPKENPGPRPPFERRVSRAEVRAKVRDDLRKSEALATIWNRPIGPEQLQAEIDRMAQGTRDPETLEAIFSALGNDARLVAECLARPVLADRLLRNWYAADERFHAVVRMEARRALEAADPESLASSTRGDYRRVVFRAEDASSGRAELGLLGRAGQPEASWRSHDVVERWVPKEELSRLAARFSEDGALRLEETPEGFSVERASRKSSSDLVVEGLFFPKRSFDDWWNDARSGIDVSAELADRSCSRGAFEFRLPKVSGRSASAAMEGWVESSLSFSGVPEGRLEHTAIWTGTEMIVWGGEGGYGDFVFDSGGRYSPATDSWRPTSRGPGCPAGRFGHTSVWTGTEMIVWGGVISKTGLSAETGARYRPSTDSWLPMSSEPGFAVPRWRHVAVWTGTEMIVWGASSDSTGGRYDPSTDSWRPTSTGANCPPPRFMAAAVWTGTEMIIWGGQNNGMIGSGGRYSPASDSWLPMSTGPSAPSARWSHTAVWTGTEMIVWGGVDGTGWSNTGGRYDPVADHWTATSTGASLAKRESHTAVWTGSEMIVWGPGDDGARYSPSNDSWAVVAKRTDSPSWRWYHTAVWTGSEMIVWGGRSGSDSISSGGRYSPATDSWLPTSTGASFPSGRSSHVSVWTGAEMVIWGGKTTASEWSTTNTGACYRPAFDDWVPTARGASSPSARYGHTAVWTGTEMIVWGGELTHDLPLASGGRYSPTTDTWRATKIDSGTPAGRIDHSAVWTGTEMIVWGGDDALGSYYSNTGGRYSPADDHWAPTSTGTSCPTPRNGHAAVWTGDRMVVWGGEIAGGMQFTSTGGVYDPIADLWVPTSASAECPPGTLFPTAVWTGSEMIVWGGFISNFMGVNTGGRYRPEADHWLPTSTGSGCPTPRYGHTAVWTGTEMIVWGGRASDLFDTGGRYTPSSDRWSPMSRGASRPSGRAQHSAVWTGTEMIAWGGGNGSGLATGGRYVTPCLSPLVVGLSAPANACSGPEGGVASVADAGAGASYEWNVSGGVIVAGGGTRQIVFQVVGETTVDFDVTVVDGSGCSGRATASLPVVTGAPTPSITGADASCNPILLTATPGYTAYRWSRDGVLIPAATGSSYSATVTGGYSVRGFVENGCSAESPAKAVAILTPGSVGNTLLMHEASRVWPQIWLLWDPASPPGRFRIWRGTTPTDPSLVLVGEVPQYVTEFHVRLDDEPTDAFYRIQAINGQCKGPID